MKIDVIGIGISVVDFVMVIPSFPTEGTKMGAMSYIIQGGGPVATALVTLAKLGAKAAYLGKVAKDEIGKYIKYEFKQYGVITDYIIEERGQSPIAVVLVNMKNGERTIIWSEGDLSPLSYEELKLMQQSITSAKFIHLDGHYPQAVLKAIEIAKSCGVKVSLDAGNVYPDIDKIIQFTDVLITSENFPTEFTGERDLNKAGKQLLEKGPQVVVITKGDKGCLCITHDEIISQPAFKVKVVDTTGAGDAFHGAFLYGLIQGWNMRKILEFSCAVAAMNCTKVGGRSGLPTLEEVKKFIGGYKRF